ncbi:MAG TPA: GntR family transcriptional regulator [Croceibacterium sp.]
MPSESPHLQFGPISSAAEGPLYEQIVAAVAREIAGGRLWPGDALPSVRNLAAELLVSVITVKRAYSELERAGVIYTRQGVGAFVAPEARTLMGKDVLADVRTALRQAIVAARQAHLADPQLFQLLRDLLKEDIAQ